MNIETAIRKGQARFKVESMTRVQLMQAIARLDRRIAFWRRFSLLPICRRKAVALEYARQALLDASPLNIGNCVNCCFPLLIGGRGYRYSDGSARADCAPTYAELQEMLKHPEGWDDEESHQASGATLQRHLNAGGSMNDQLHHEL